MKLVCVHCEIELKVVRNGVAVIEMWDDPPEPYKIWASDVWGCPACQCEIAFVERGQVPAKEHYQANFQDVLQVATSKGAVYDYERKGHPE